MKISNFLLIFIQTLQFYVIFASKFSLPPLENLSKISSKHEDISACQVCHSLVQSFMLAVKETTRQSFEGGDADWEKEKLGNYENSELRFIEIQEKLCFDLKSGSDQCHNLAEIYETDLESWFFNKRERQRDLFTYLCVNSLKICCPNNTYGANCIPCPGGIDEPCSGHGKCKNGGTREEPGECVCYSGYTGHLCDECEVGYYKESNTSNFTCKVCDKACKDHCRGSGPNSCEVCADGYNFIPNKGCIEIQEEDDDSNQSCSDNDIINLEYKPEALDINSQQSNHQEL